MRDTDYAFCVARLRANEKYMLTAKDIDELCECGSFDLALKILTEKKWLTTQTQIDECIAYQNKKLWKLLSECVPDKNELKVLCTVNDFFNIKVAVKCHFTSADASELYIYPATLDTAALTSYVNSHEFHKIGGIMGECAEKSYKAACLTENGQNADIIIDAAAINTLREYSLKNKKSLIGEVCAFICDTANIKTAYRCAKTKKGKDFVSLAVGECCRLDRGFLIKASLSGVEALSEYLRKTSYSELSETYLKSSAEYEKKCDDEIVSIIKKAKFTAFGFDPVCAYYYGKLTEIKSVRIILTSLKAGLDKNTVRERVRALYV
ncbi:MAG: V-type ATPase subunit [Clostridia bacterium]|nr:V-type ATPase subunit [Clostridia bacterium]